MATEEIHVGDTGTDFRITLSESAVAVDISGATSLVMKFEKPDGTDVSQTAHFYTDGTDGIVEYTTLASDLDQTGKWKVQAQVDMPSWQGHSEIASFKVYANLS